jgi:lipopolysaccharide heptosyltransferase II
VDIDMKRILIIEPNWLGDILFTIPSIRAIKKSIPSAFIGVVVHPRCKEMLEDNPNIDKLILFDEKISHRGLIKKLFFISDLRKLKFDTVICFHRSMSRTLIAYLSGISRRVGYYTRKRSWLLTDSLRQKRDAVHRVEYFLNLLRSIGIDSAGQYYEFNIPEAVISDADIILKDAGVNKGEDFFIINPGGNWPQKRWPKQNYAMLCEKLHNIYNYKILVTGSREDINLASDIIGPGGNYAANICGKTDLKQLAAVMSKAKIVVANDSGPMHIAASQKAPLIAIFGPTSPMITGPRGSGKCIVLHKCLDCIVPCYNKCYDYRCMSAISVADVLSAVKELLDDVCGI